MNYSIPITTSTHDPHAHTCHVIDQLKQTALAVRNDPSILSKINMNLILNSNYLTRESQREFKISKNKMNELIRVIERGMVILDSIMRHRSIQIEHGGFQPCWTDEEANEIFKRCDIELDDIKQILDNFGVSRPAHDECNQYVSALRRFGSEIRGSRYADAAANNVTLNMVYENLNDREPEPTDVHGTRKAGTMTLVFKVAQSLYYQKFHKVFIKDKREVYNLFMSCDQLDLANLIKEELEDYYITV